MAESISEYIESRALDSDVFFTGFDGLIEPEMKQDWMQQHDEAVAHPHIEYDTETGFYTVSVRVPNEVASNYTNNRKAAEKLYAENPQLSLVFSSAGVFIVGTVQSPGTATMLAKFVEDTPAMVA